MHFTITYMCLRIQTLHCSAQEEYVMQANLMAYHNYYVSFQSAAETPHLNKLQSKILNSNWQIIHMHTPSATQGQ